MKVDHLPPRARVFVDTNVFLYHLADASTDCTRLLELVEQRIVAGFTSLLVLEEVAFRRLVAEAVARYGWSLATAVRHLRRQPEAVKALTSPWQEVSALASLFTVIEPALADLLKSREVQESYGLFGSDAINASLMRKADIKYIATADRDFERLDFATRIEIAVP